MRLKLLSSLCFAIAFSTFIFCFSSCVCDCEDPGFELLKFVDKDTGKNLFFGFDTKYKIEDINIFSLKNQKQINATILDPELTPQIDSAISVRLNIAEFNRFFVKIGGSDIDTIDVTTDVIKKGCCSGNVVMRGFKYNGEIINNNENWQRVIVK
jgi:hypothetical protein